MTVPHAQPESIPPSGEDPGPIRPADDDPDFVPEPETPPLTLVRTTVNDDAGAPPTDSLGDGAERAVLAAILEGHAVPVPVVALLDAGMFRRSRHRVLYEVLCEMAAQNVPIDEVTLLARLNGQLDQVGGPEYVASLIGAVGNPATLTHYAGIVRSRAIRRWLTEAARDLQGLAGDPHVPQAQVAIAAARAEQLLRALTERVERATIFEPPLLADFAAQAPPEAEWVLPGYAAKGAVTVVGGHPKIGKTTFAAEAAGEVSVGANFLGKATGGGAVLWIDLEQPRGLTNRRLTEACVKGAPVYVQWGQLPAYDALQRFCLEKQVVLVVIDSLAKLFERAGVDDENDATQVGRALQPLLDFARAADVAVLVIGHLRKSGGTEGLDIRGSVAITAAVDIVVSFRRYDTSAEAADPRRVLEAYSRYEETPHKLVIERVDGRYRPCGSVAEVKRRTEREAVLAVLSTEPQTAEDVASAAKMAPSAARTVLKLLTSEPENARIVIRTGTGKKNDAFRYSKCLRAQTTSVSAQSFQHPETAPSGTPEAAE